MNTSKTRLLRAGAVSIFAGFFIFWAIIAASKLQGDTNTAELYSALYGLMALYGGVIGLAISKKWGGAKSLIGRSVLFMSLGLLAQEAGQITYSMYTYLLHREIPYPSLGDIGYFASVILYILAAYNLLKALGIKAAIRSHTAKLWVVILPVLLLSASYYVFLKGHTHDTHNLISVFLDFGYPLGQAFYISLGLLALVISKKYLGGVMKPVVLFLIFALALQYSADFMFLYQVSRDTWKTGGANELVYLVSYFVMTLSLIEFGAVLGRLRTPKSNTEVQ